MPTNELVTYFKMLLSVVSFFFLMADDQSNIFPLSYLLFGHNFVYNSYKTFL